MINAAPDRRPFDRRLGVTVNEEDESKVVEERIARCPRSEAVPDRSLKFNYRRLAETITKSSIRINELSVVMLLSRLWLKINRFKEITFINKSICNRQIGAFTALSSHHRLHQGIDGFATKNGTTSGRS